MKYQHRKKCKTQLTLFLNDNTKNKQNARPGIHPHAPPNKPFVAIVGHPRRFIMLSKNSPTVSRGCNLIGVNFFRLRNDEFSLANKISPYGEMSFYWIL